MRLPQSKWLLPIKRGLSKMKPTFKVPFFKSPVGAKSSSTIERTGDTSSIKTKSASAKKAAKTRQKNTKLKQRQANKQARADAKKAKLNASKEKLVKLLNATGYDPKVFNVEAKDFIDAHYDGIVKQANLLKSIFYKLSPSAKTQMKSLSRKLVKNPTPEVVASYIKQLYKVTSSVQRQATAEFAKNMAQYLPIGFAAAIALSGLDD